MVHRCTPEGATFLRFATLDFAPRVSHADGTCCACDGCGKRNDVWEDSS
jgi:hypothetical protein